LIGLLHGASNWEIILKFIHFHLMYSDLGAVTAPGWTDIHARLPLVNRCPLPSFICYPFSAG